MATSTYMSTTAYVPTGSTTSTKITTSTTLTTPALLMKLRSMKIRITPLIKIVPICVNRIAEIIWVVICHRAPIDG